MIEVCQNHAAMPLNVGIDPLIQTTLLLWHGTIVTIQEPTGWWSKSWSSSLKLISRQLEWSRVAGFTTISNCGGITVGKEYRLLTMLLFNGYPLLYNENTTTTSPCWKIQPPSPPSPPSSPPPSPHRVHPPRHQVFQLQLAALLAALVQRAGTEHLAPTDPTGPGVTCLRSENTFSYIYIYS